MEQNIHTSSEKVSFNQAVFQQVRIDTLLKRVDALNINPLYYNIHLKQYNYQIMFNDYCSLLQTISPHLTDVEVKRILTQKFTIENLIEKKPPFKMNHEEHRNNFSQENWKELNKDLFIFRMELERLMHIHGFGNPLKDNPSKAVFKGV